MADPSNSISSVGDLLLGASRNSLLNTNKASIDNALGAAASLGLGVAVLRWLFNAYRRPALEAEGTAGSDDSVMVVRGGLLDAIMSSIRRSLRRLLLDADELRQFESIHLVDEVHVVDGAMITHQGSCHCQSVRFEIRAPRTLVAMEGPGKIQYRHTETKSSSFRVVRGQPHLKTYYVRNFNDRGAHAFCERCGCHILFAPSKNSTRLMINVNCMDEGIRKIKVVDTKSSLSTGVPLEEQWDDQLSTISEVSQDPHFDIRQTQFRNLDSLSTGGGSINDWKLYDELDKLEPASSQRTYFAPPRTPTTVDSFTAPATDTQSLPALRIPLGVSDTASIMTESDMFSVTRSEYNMGPSKALPQLHDQMKYYMKKHVSPTSKFEHQNGVKQESNR